MTGGLSTVARTVAGRPIHKRHHVKVDGRNLYLYGFAPSTATPVEGVPLKMSAGSELRRHPLRGGWAIYAARRQNRTFKPSVAEDPLAPSRPGQPITEIPFEAFEVAVFENRFPTLYQGAAEPTPSRLETARASGACEVIVYSPEPAGSLATLSQDRRRLLLEVWVDRYIALHGAGCAYVLPFENRGEEVGVTLHHPHGQIYGFPLVPPPQDKAAEAFANGYDLAREMAGWRDELWVGEAGGLVAYAPPFARFPYEVWISGLAPVSGPWAFDEEQSDGFCHLLGDITARYDRFFGRATPYMLTLHASPRGRDDNFQFSAQFYPLLRAPDRLKYLAAVEQATGIFTVDVMPEQVAADLKGAS